jgi:hypothetical protein
MANTPTKVIVDCSTGEQTIVPLTADEIAQLEADRIAWEAQEVARKEAEATKQAEKEAIANKLGLTSEELVKLLS